MKDLGELIYAKSFSRTIFVENDRNGHLNNSCYSDYSEDVRQEFLRSFGWEDANFNGKKISMLVGERRIKYKKSLKRLDEIKIELKVFFRGNPFFHMVYTFYTPLGKKAATDQTTITFANFGTERAINIPDFFLEEIRNC